MMKVICNASPIIGLIGIGKLNLLWELFDEVMMPESVYQELIAGDRNSERLLIEEAIERNQIKVIKILGKDIATFLYGKLHLGELETIIGAMEDPSVKFAIIDEKAARAFAATMLVDTLGILGVLKYAKSKGKIQDIRSHMDLLIHNGYRISDSLYHHVLEMVNEL